MTGYRLVRGVAALLLWLFYRRIDVSHAERIPRQGPLVIAANHHNALVDPMLIITSVPRRIVPLAKAPLFRHPLIAPFLKLIGAVPVHRRVDGADPRQNAAMFAAAVDALRVGDTLLIFPEGVSQPRPTLMPLRTGAARIVLSAAAEGVGVALVPVGLVFDDPGTFRTATALLSVGPPVAVPDLVEQYASAPDSAVRSLTERLADAIRAQIVEAEDHHTLELLGTLERAWRHERGEPARAEPALSLAWRREVMRAARALGERDPVRVAVFRRHLERYAERLRESGLSDGQLGQRYTVRMVTRYTLANAFNLSVMLPLAVLGMAAHAVPYALTDLVARALVDTAEEEATDKMAAGLVLYPLCWIVEGWLLWRGVGAAWLAAFLVLLVPSGLVALAWRERLARVGRQARAFARFLVDRRAGHDLLAERRALVEEAEALGALSARPRTSA
ncbi:MAG TPA: 1-acyl-sn-glycerol-3-phosphate acyltransferase [Methylomirabilota bacterium]|jgi:1-acyl-sn-glycerol-3-phosphate acyltransferase